MGAEGFLGDPEFFRIFTLTPGRILLLKISEEILRVFDFRRNVKGFFISNLVSWILEFSVMTFCLIRICEKSRVSEPPAPTLQK